MNNKNISFSIALIYYVLIHDFWACFFAILELFDFDYIFTFLRYSLLHLFGKKVVIWCPKSFKIELLHRKDDEEEEEISLPIK